MEARDWKKQFSFLAWHHCAWSCGFWEKMQEMKQCQVKYACRSNTKNPWENNDKQEMQNLMMGEQGGALLTWHLTWWQPALVMRMDFSPGLSPRGHGCAAAALRGVWPCGGGSEERHRVLVAVLGPGCWDSTATNMARLPQSLWINLTDSEILLCLLLTEGSREK